MLCTEQSLPPSEEKTSSGETADPEGQPAAENCGTAAEEPGRVLASHSRLSDWPDMCVSEASWVRRGASKVAGGEAAVARSDSDTVSVLVAMQEGGELRGWWCWW